MSVWLLVYVSGTTGTVFCVFRPFSLQPLNCWWCSSRAVVNTAGRAGRASVGSLIACILSGRETRHHYSPSGEAAPPIRLETKLPASSCHWWLCSLKAISRKMVGFTPNMTFAWGGLVLFKLLPFPVSKFPKGQKREIFWHFFNLSVNHGLKLKVPFYPSPQLVFHLHMIQRTWSDNINVFQFHF